MEKMAGRQTTKGGNMLNCLAVKMILTLVAIIEQDDNTKRYKMMIFCER